MQKYLLLPLFLYITCLPLAVHSENLSIQDLDIQARSIGLGKSLVAAEDYAASDNPASLGSSFSNTTTTMALSLSQARLAYDSYGYEAMCLIAMGESALGIQFDQRINQNTSYYRLLYNSDGTPVIDPTTNQQATQLTYDTQMESMFGLAYGLKIIPGFSLGIQGQVMHAKVGENYAWGFDAIGGLRIRIIEKMDVGLCIKQANGGWVAWRKPYLEECVRPVGEAGIAWHWEAMHILMTAAVSQTLEWNILPKGKIGVEYLRFSPLALRLGWDADHLSLGAGFNWKSIALDYAAIIGNAQYDANRITINIKF